MAMGSTRVFSVAAKGRNPVTDWLTLSLAVLALAQISPFSSLSLGFLAAGILSTQAPLPAAALAGLALDLSRITPVPMTAVMCLTFLLRLIPGLPRLVSYFSPAFMYLLVAPLSGVFQWSPVIPLALGGSLGALLPPQTPISHRRGETGLAQVRLELAATALGQTEQILSEIVEYPIDEEAIMSKAVDRACGCCPCRKHCPDLEAAAKLPVSLLHRPLVTVEDLHFFCRKRGRMLLELRRGQDQYRTIRADRDKQKEYRWALIQQYRFLCSFLQELSNQLPRRGENLQPRYIPSIAVRSAGLEAANGDRCLWFAGTGCLYYVLLCDGMGTGIGAEAEGRTAANLLKRMLTAGYPAEHALRSLNSLCTLRNRAGAVTVDLAQVDLRRGQLTLYKWGGAPSWLVSGQRAEKIGTAAAPPGLSVTDTRETVDKLSLRRGETLILLSDGVDGEAAMRRISELTNLTPGEMAPRVLQYGRGNGSDDATAAVIRLYPQTLST
jgi:serine/threonine protein phosphatase PrpC